MLSTLLLAATLASATRLPADVAPKHYDLAFDVDPAQGRFAGTVDIDVDVRAPVSGIVLHSVDLTLSEASVSQADSVVHPEPVSHPADETVSLAAPLRRGSAHVHLAFAAPLRHDLRGLYLAKSHSGELWAATQFEPVDARRAFPCFDEPAFKATFSTRVHTAAALAAVSNGVLTADRPDGKGGHTLEFATTVPLPSYLVALAVGHFGILEGKAGAVPLRVIVPAGQEQLGRFALAVAEQVVPWYEQYTGIVFPFPKLDMVAIPEFEPGGMENAGAIFYRDAALLLDDGGGSSGPTSVGGKSPVAQQQSVERVVAHEIAHQWFGDLVTMAWWDDLWLNEAFASLMGDQCVRALRPEWPMAQLHAAVVSHAKLTDSLRDTHAIHAAVADPAQANGQFDEITYRKGEGVLAMLAQAAGDEGWRGGLHRYLISHAYGNARAEDLWDAVGDVSGKTIAEMAHGWIYQAGHPVVRVKRGEGSAATLEQRPFTLSPAPDSGRRWLVPVCLRVSPSPSEAGRGRGGGATSSPDCVVLSDRPLTHPTPKGGWLFANAGGEGVYRVAYDTGAQQALLDPLRQLALDPAERITLLRDSEALALSGDGKLTTLLDEMAALGADRDSEVVDALGDLDWRLSDQVVSEADRDRLRRWVRRQLSPIAAELGWQASPDEPPERAQLRAAVVRALDRSGGDAAVAAEAARRLQAGVATLDPTLRDTVLAVAARHGNAALWEALRTLMVEAREPGLRNGCQYALSAFEDPALVQKSLALAIDGTVAPQNVGYLLRDLFDNPKARAATWAFFQRHVDELKPLRTGLIMGRSVLPALGGFCSLKERDDIAAFFAAHPFAGGERPLARALESIEICARTKTRQQLELHRWLSAHR